jgi:hypothetical protein
MNRWAKTILGGWLGQAHSQGVGNTESFTNIQEILTKYAKCTRENARNSLPK